MGSRHGFWFATAAVVFAMAFTAWALFSPAYTSGETIWTLVAFGVVGAASIGLFVLPVAIVLVLASYVTPVATR